MVPDTFFLRFLYLNKFIIASLVLFFHSPCFLFHFFSFHIFSFIFPYVIFFLFLTYSFFFLLFRPFVFNFLP